MNGQHIVANPQHKSDAEIAREHAKEFENRLFWAQASTAKYLTILGSLDKTILAAITEARQQGDDTARVTAVASHPLWSIKWQRDEDTAMKWFVWYNGRLLSKDADWRTAIDAARRQP